MRKIRLSEASQIYLAMTGDTKAQEEITLDSVNDYLPAETFERFLKINQLQTYEYIPREG